MKRIAVYGATGSVGSQALDVVRRCRGLLRIGLMSCHDQVDRLAEAANAMRPEQLVVTSACADIGRLESLLDYSPDIMAGPDSLLASVGAASCDLALNAVPGIDGLPLLAACLEAGLPTALANKESIVSGGEVIRTLWRSTGTPIYPVDSEHAAIYECLGDSFDSSRAETLWLTASGGPFLHADAAAMENATVTEALQHPTWNMGRKISVDSATMANKGLEVIEARYLFDVPADRIRVVIQPTSVVHSMVTFRDTTVLAQLGAPDMRVPIERALLGRQAGRHPLASPIDFWEIGSVEFLRPDFARFPCLELAYTALAAGETAVYCAADDAAVQLFLEERVRFGQIPELIREALTAFQGRHPRDVAGILELDSAVHGYVKGLLT